MTTPTIRQYQCYRDLRHAQGLLELICCQDDSWGLDPLIRRRLARRALGLLKDARPTGPRRAIWYYVRGRLLAIRGQRARATRCLRAAIKVDPANISAYLALGSCFRQANRIDQAIIALRRAVEHAPHHAVARYNLACYLSLDLEPESAAMELAIALELKPELRELAATDADFDPIRDHPAFDAAVQVIV